MRNKYWNKPKDIFAIENHQFETFIPLQAKHLIIGTFPTHEKNSRFKFYYSSNDNLFWNVIEEVFDYRFKYFEDVKAIEERKGLLQQKKIGMTDMIGKCYRRNEYSTDENIYPIILRDIFSIIEQHRTIEVLVLTSRTEVFGALGLLNTYFLQRGFQLEKPKLRDDRILEGNFSWASKNYKLLVPYSPSSRLIEGKITTFNELVEMYKKCLI